MKKSVKKIFCLTLLMIFLISTNSIALQTDDNLETTEQYKSIDSYDILDRLVAQSTGESDLDPLVDLEVSVVIKEIRGFDKIDLLSEPDFYVKVIFEGLDEFTSPIWKNQNHVEEEWIATQNVPDTKEWVDITIQLWDKDPVLDKLCDIASNDNDNPYRRQIELSYNLKTGHWLGDDMMNIPHSWFVDYSGYGRANGCDDNSIYENDLDCELFFDIVQNDIDGDGFPYWTETEVFGTDPAIDDRGRDDDEDGIPIEWEYKWGHRIDYVHDHKNYSWSLVYYWEYDPFEYNDFENIDIDGDSINNYEEYLTWALGSDPTRKDLFVELDEMAAGPGGEPEASLLPEGSKELLYKAFNRQNIVFHLDDGDWVQTGHEILPFDNTGDNTTGEEFYQYYYNHFLQGNNDSWKRGVFHYGLVVYNASGYPGFCFRNNAFQISRLGMEKQARLLFTGNRDVVYASAYMHEFGHSLNLEWLFGHTTEAYHPWQIKWWLSRPYRSVMNYGYMYGTFYNLVDYSDGSRGFLDHDDWSNIDYPYFELEDD